jgi:hypothetical protein
VHPALVVAFRHFLMDDPAAGGHPLHVAARQRAAVAEAVAVIDLAGEHVGDGFDAAMGMPWEAGEVLVGVVVAKIVEQQKRIELLWIAEPESALQFHAGAFEGRLWFQDFFDGSY